MPDSALDEGTRGPGRPDAGLRECVERNRLIVETTAQGIWVVDAAGRTTYANRALSGILGRPIDDIMGRAPEDFAFPEEREAVAAERRRHLVGESAVFERRFRRADGSTVWVDIAVTPVPAQEGGSAGAFALVTDITDRRRLQDALRDRAQRQRAGADLAQRALTGESPDALLDDVCRTVAAALDVELVAALRLAPDRRLLSVVAGVGWPGEPAVLPPVDAAEGTLSARALATAEPVVAQGAGAHDPFVNSGYLAELGVRASMAVVVGTPERPWGILSAHTRRSRTFTEDDVDFVRMAAATMGAAITRHRTIEELRASEQRHRTLVTLMPDAVGVTDREGRLTFVSPRAAQIFGTSSADELLGIRVMDWVLPADRETAAARVACVLRGEDTPPAVYRMRRADGSATEVEIASRPLRDDQGHPVALVSVLRDASRRREQEREHLRLRDELAQARRMETIGNLAGGVAHDFNNLLSVMLTGSELALRGLPVDSPVRLEIEECRAAAVRAAALTRQLLAFSRRQVVAPQRLPPDECLADTASLLRRLIGENIVLDVALGAGDVAVWLDPTQLEQAVMNLAVNARDAMPRGGTLRIASRVCEPTAERRRAVPGLAPGAHVEIAVADDGEGMAPEVMARVFEPFFTTKAAERGTGLGLSVVYGIVKQGGGHVEVESEPGRGSTFRMLFPVVGAIAGLKRAADAAAAAHGRGERILLVEDEDSVRRALGRVLAGAGYAVTAEAHPAAALDRFRAGPGAFDLVVTDVLMPGMSGVELGGRLRAIRPELRIIYCSGYAQGRLDEGLRPEAGAVFLEKPVEQQVLLGRVRELLDRPAA